MFSRSNCLYCGRKLSLWKRLGKLQFCSDEHESIHQRESDLLVIARLHQSASTDYGMASWKLAYNSDDPQTAPIFPPKRNAAEALRPLEAALRPLDDALRSLAAALELPAPEPTPVRRKSRLMLTAGKSEP